MKNSQTEKIGKTTTLSQEDKMQTTCQDQPKELILYNKIIDLINDQIDDSEDKLKVRPNDNYQYGRKLALKYIKTSMPYLIDLT